MRAILWSATLALGVLLTPAHAQWNPTRPIRIIVPYPPGGASDVAARTITDGVSKRLGQPVLVENRPGAGGIVGTEAVYRAEPDGYTLLLGASDAISIAPHLQPELTRYKSEEFVAIAPVNQITTILVARPGLDVKNVAELVALAKKSKLSYSSWGNGSLGHVSGETFKSAAKVDLLNVPYQGAAPAAQAVLGGQVDLMFMPGPLWISYRDRVTTLGALSPRRFENVPTLAEQGVSVVVEIWQAILAPPKTPKPVVDRLHAAFSEVMTEPEIKEKFAKMGSVPLSSTQEAFQKMILADVPRWRKILADSDIRPQQ
ncbi:MAG TPA: tripartite tricarboxylate transporter substrate binding protein [Burkholderiales bacterium]|nr:tripartite tricarboxylate transporter substrate binding protein [Burkholderiales bacterium]